MFEHCQIKKKQFAETEHSAKFGFKLYNKNMLTRFLGKMEINMFYAF